MFIIYKQPTQPPQPTQPIQDILLCTYTHHHKPTVVAYSGFFVGIGGFVVVAQIHRFSISTQYSSWIPGIATVHCTIVTQHRGDRRTHITNPIVPTML